MTNAPLMPMATAVWLVENTTLTFKQIANFCNLHEVEIQAPSKTHLYQHVVEFPKGLDPETVALLQKAS